jgi:hypothetical protein
LKWHRSAYGVRRSVWPQFGIVTLAQAQPAAADASSSASVDLRDYPPSSPPNISVVGTSGSDLVSTSLPSGASGSAQSVLGTGSLGVQLQLPSTANGGLYYVQASWYDNWRVRAVSQVPTVPVMAVITLEGSIDKSFIDASNTGTEWDGAADLNFQYAIGDHVLGVDMGSDGSVPSIYAHFDSTNITSALTFSPDPTDPLSTRFSLTYAPAVDVLSSGFTDSMTATLYVEGNSPSIDAIRTFRARLQSLDPTVVLAADSGRAIASAVPEPASALLLGAGLAGVCLARRRECGPRCAFRLLVG